MNQLTGQPKPAFYITAVAIGLSLILLSVSRLGFNVNPLNWIRPPQTVESKKLAPIDVPAAGEQDSASTSARRVNASAGSTVRAGNLDVPIRFRHYAWNSHMGVILANGGKDTRRGSIMDQYGVKLHLERTDSNDVFMAEAIAFATAVKNGTGHPTQGAHFFSMMGDGSAPMLYKLNSRIAKELGHEYQYKIFGSTGRSYGEDKFLGPKEWKSDPSKMRGQVVITVLQDGDMNIVLKFASDNNIPVNPDPTTIDPDALNFENAPDNDFLKAAQVFVTGPSVTRDEVRNGKKTGKQVTVPIRGVATWTPGDELVVNQLGGVVSIADTKLYSGQMPQAIMGCDKWLQDNRATVEAFLAASFEASERIKDPRTRDEALAEGAKYSALVYNEKPENDGEYWAQMYKGETVSDRYGNMVTLGGSRVFNLADALRLFGIAPQGAANGFKATYTVFGEMLSSLYPGDIPTIYKWEDIADPSYLEALQGRIKTTEAEAPTFRAEAPIKQASGRRVYPINFVFGNAEFAPGAEGQLEELKNALLIAENAAVEINGHTDSVGSADKNQRLSEHRASAVADWLRNEAPANFTPGRVRSNGMGMSQPLNRKPGESEEAWRARCRRVEVVIGR